MRDRIQQVSDTQSLNDLGGSFERVQEMRVVVGSRYLVLTVLAGALLPMVPLVLAEIGAVELVLRVGKAVL